MKNIYPFFHIYLLNRRQLSGSLRRVDTTPQNFNWSSRSHLHHPPPPSPPLPYPHIRDLYVFCNYKDLSILYYTELKGVL